MCGRNQLPDSTVKHRVSPTQRLNAMYSRNEENPKIIRLDDSAERAVTAWEGESSQLG